MTWEWIEFTINLIGFVYCVWIGKIFHKETITKEYKHFDYWLYIMMSIIFGGIFLIINLFCQIILFFNKRKKK